MPDLTQQLSFNFGLAGAEPAQLLAHTPGGAQRADEIRPPRPDERCAPDTSQDWRYAPIAAIVLSAAIALAIIAGPYFFSNRQTIEQIDVKALVERIIKVESAGNANKKNKLSSATGAGQFLDDTWLEAIRKHRRDLTKGRSDKELLELRRDTELTREIMERLVEQYARTLHKRGLPLTSGSLYLAYFAGPAGAVALLSGAEHADAASVMAAADSTGRTTRQKLVKANPFLEVLTVRDLKNWADHKMRGI